MLEMIADLLDLAEDLGRVRALKWQISANHGVEDNPDRPHINLDAVQAVEDLRRHVIGCALDIAKPASDRHVSLRKAEVYQAHHIVLVDHDVIRLDITMYNVQCMAVIDRFKETLHIVCNLRLFYPLLRRVLNLLEQASAFDVLHDHVDVLQVIVRLIIAHNIRMI